MNTTPLFSIITITYNAEKEITPTLESINSQSFRNFEHLIIDGASKDLTLKIALKYAANTTKIVSEPDNGLYDAMNKGIKDATGRYLLFLNAGDAFHAPDTLQLYADAAKENADIIYGDTILVDSDRNFVGKRHLSAPKRLTFDSFKQGMLVCHQAFAVKRELAPFYNLDYRFSADYEWCLRCLQKSKPEHCINLNTITIDYLTDGLTDKNHKASLKERFNIMCRYYGTLPTILRHAAFMIRYALRKLSSH